MLLLAHIAIDTAMHISARCVIGDGLLFARLFLSLMVEHLIRRVHGVRRALLAHVPWGVLDELWHMLKVDLLHARLRSSRGCR